MGRQRHLRDRRIMEVDWRTAKKYADVEELPVPQQRKRKRLKMDPFMEHVKGMIQEDMSQPQPGFSAKW